MSRPRERSQRPEDPHLPRVRVELYGGLAAHGSATAFIRTFDAAAADWVTLDDEITVWDALGATYGAGDLVYCTFWPDSRRWEVDGGGGGGVRFIHFALEEALTTADDSAAAIVHHHVGGDPSPVRVWNSENAWAGDAGKRGGAIFDRENDKFWIWWLEC